MKHVFRIGVFDDLEAARRAVDDAMASGVRQNDITMICSEDETAELEKTHARFIVHPALDTERGHYGGALGAAIGGFGGSMIMVLAGNDGWLLLLDFISAAALGSLAGGFLARWIPYLLRWGWAGLKRSTYDFDNSRSLAAGAIGGAFGAMAGTLATYLIGASDLWYFVSTGLWAGMTSLIVGALVGAMTGRGLAPASTGDWEDLVDGGHKVLVSVDCSNRVGNLPEIEELLKRDGALQIKTA